MKKQLFIFSISLFTVLQLNAQTQTQNLNMGLYQLQFPSANGGSNRVQSYGGSFPGKWEFKSRFDDIYIDAGENSSNTYDILFLTGGVERARVNSNGNFGIGTTNPSEKLQIGDGFAFHNGGHNVLFFNYSSGSAGGDLSPTKYASELRFDPVNGDLRLGTSSSTTNAPSTRLIINKDGFIGIGTSSPTSKLDVRGIIKSSHANGNYINLFTSGDGNSYMNFTGGSTTSRFGFQIDGSNKMSITNSGNVGVGTTSPLSEFHVEGVNAAGEAGITIKNKDASIGTRSVIDFITTTTNTLYGSLGVENTSLGAGAMTFSTRGGDFEKMRITSNGNVGIGTSTPDSKLTVAGNIHSQEVKVTVDAGADFVFHEDYKLPKLEDVEAFVKANKHLPEIASEKEMQANGLLLANMNIKLLQKIEELTLYTIDQEKRIENLEQENKTLKSQQDQIKALEDKVNTLLNLKP